MLLLLLACNQPVAIPGVNPGITGIVVNAPDYEGRARAAWERTGPAELTGKGITLVEKVGTKIAVDVPEKLSGLPKDAQALDLRTNDAVLKALTGVNEAAAADAIRAAGAKVLIVHTDIRASFDRDSHVLSRLYHHDSLDRFQLARVENNALVYLVVDQPLQFPEELANQCIQWLRALMTNQRPLPFPALKPERGNWTLITTLRGQGQELAVSLAEADTLDKALIETADDLETMWRRQREILGFPRIDRALPDLRFEIHRTREMADVVPRDEAALEDLWEMGIDGAVLRDRVGDKKQSGMWPGDVAVTRGITKADSFLKQMAREFRWDSVRPWRDPEVELQLIRTTHYLEVPDKKVVELYRGTMPVPMDVVTLATAKSAIVYSGEWYLANLKPDGAVTYKVWPEENRYSNEDNHVRHELATWNLVQAWTLDPRPEFLEGAKRAQDWTLRYLVERDGTNFEPWERAKVDVSPFKDAVSNDGMAYFNYGGVNKLGSVVVGLMGMIDLAKATGDHQYDPLMRKLGRFILFSQESNGSVRPYHVPPGHKYEKEKNDIVPGEAALALVMLAEYFNDPQYLDALPKFFGYYKPWYTERAARKSLTAPWPAFIYGNQDRLDLVQFGPWTVMAAAAYTRMRPEATDIVDFGLEVGRWMVDAYAYTGERTPWPDYVGGYYKFEGELPAMQAFCYGEGTAAAYAMAIRAGRKDEAKFFGNATRETVRFALAVQHDGLDTYAFSRPTEIAGGTKYAMNEPKVRIDYVYHAQSTIYQWLRAAESDPDLDPALRAEPDEKLRAWLAVQDMPGYRPEGAPVRTSVPPATAVDPGVPAVVEDEEAGGE